MTDNNDTPEVEYAGKGVSLKRFWYCPTCLVSVTTFVTLADAPSHACKKQTGKTIPLITKGDSK